MKISSTISTWVFYLYFHYLIFKLINRFLNSSLTWSLKFYNTLASFIVIISCKIATNYVKNNRNQIKTFILLLCLNRAIKSNFAFNKIIISLFGEYYDQNGVLIKLVFIFRWSTGLRQLICNNGKLNRHMLHWLIKFVFKKHCMIKIPFYVIYSEICSYRT